MSSFEIVDTIADLLTINSAIYQRVMALAYDTLGDAPPSWYYANPADTTSAQNGVTIFVGADGMRWYLADCRTINFRRGGCKFDGATDDTASVLAVLKYLAPGGRAESDGGTAIISSTINIPQGNISLVDKGHTTFKAAPNSNFDYIMLGTGLNNVRIGSFTFDANQSARATGQNIRFMGAGFISCTDCVFDETRSMNTLGYQGVSAVGLVLGGNCIRCDMILPKAINCGNSGEHLSDGIFTSGNHNKIISPRSHFCTDTGTVIESSNFSSAIDVISEQCGAAAAITNATDNDCTGNSIHGIKGDNCLGGVTGVVSIGIPISTTMGNLFQTRVSELQLISKENNGPGLNVHRTGPGSVMGFSAVGVAIDGMGTQGALIEAQDFELANVDIQGTGASSIQIQGSASDGRLSNLKTAPPSGYFGLYSDGNKNIKTTDHINSGGQYAEYFDGIASGCSYQNVQSNDTTSGVVGNSPTNLPTSI